jgi:hypothetical protein
MCSMSIFDMEKFLRALDAEVSMYYVMSIFLQKDPQHHHWHDI